MALQRRESSVTGFVQEALAGFENERDFSPLESVDRQVLRADRLDYFRSYARENFCGPLIPGMGTEEILDVFAQVPRVRSWLDLGSGPSTLFWACALAEAQSINCADVAPEALEVFREFSEGGEAPRCYMDALARFGRSRGHLERMRKRVRSLLVFDFSQAWPLALSHELFDLISAIGCFGLSSDQVVFHQCLAEARGHLTPRGTIIGANWLRSEQSILEEGYDTRFLTEGFLRQAFQLVGLQTQVVQNVPIVGSERYRAVVIWMARDPSMATLRTW